MTQRKGRGAVESNAKVFELVDVGAITKMRDVGMSWGLGVDEVNRGHMESVSERIFCVCPARLDY